MSPADGFAKYVPDAPGQQPQGEGPDGRVHTGEASRSAVKMLDFGRSADCRFQISRTVLDENSLQARGPLTLRQAANAAPSNPVPISIKEPGSGTTAAPGSPNN